MSIASIATSPSSTTTKSDAPANQLQGNSTEFLKLFMAQLQNQNPLDPKDGADMVSQLATFSQVEQATKTNQELAALLAAQTSDASAGMSTLVGRNCSAGVGTFSIDDQGGTPPPIEVTATSSMKGGTLQIKDAEGNIVKTINLPDAKSGTIQWDGTDDKGHKLPAGNYTMSVNGGSAATVDAEWQGRVDSVELATDGTRLRMGGVLINPSDIRTIGASTAAQGSK